MSMNEEETHEEWLKKKTMITARNDTKRDLEKHGIKSDSFDIIIHSLLTLADNHWKEYKDIIQAKRTYTKEVDKK